MDIFRNEAKWADIDEGLKGYLTTCTREEDAFFALNDRIESGSADDDYLFHIIFLFKELPSRRSNTRRKTVRRK